MPETNGEHAAFPIDESQHLESGLSKRELFAAMALQGLLAGGEYASYRDLAINAVVAANELLAALNTVRPT